MNLNLNNPDLIALNPELAGLSKTFTYKSKPERIKTAGDDHDSLLESDFDLELTSRGWPHVHHPWSFNLPGAVGYEPDFIAWPDGDRPIVYEVKGNNKMKNARDSRTRFRIAAGLHRWARFIWVTRTPRGQWIEKEYRP